MPDLTLNVPDGNNGGSIPVGALPFMNGYNGGNGFFGGNAWGGGMLGFLFGLLCGNGGLGNGFFGGGNNNNVDLLMQAVNNSGERSVSAVQQLATNLNMDFNLLNSGVQTLSTAVNQIANAQGLNAMQIINALQSGNAAMQNLLAQCCCQMQNTLQAGVNSLQQSGNANTQSILGELRAMQTQALQDKLDAERAKNSQLAGEISQQQQNAAIAGMIANSVNPLQAQLYALNNTVEAIKRCQPETITLPNNSMTAVPTLWANGVADLVVDRIASALTPAPTTSTTPVSGAASLR